MGDDKTPENKRLSMALGVILERRVSNHPWGEDSWQAVEVLPDAPPLDPAGPWTPLGREGEGARVHAGTLPLTLHRGETEGYRVNLTQDEPRVYVVLRDGEAAAPDHELQPFLVTVCPYEAQDYLDSGEEIVEAVPMPPLLQAMVGEFVRRHHVEQPFKKRRRRRADEDSRDADMPPRGGRRG